MPEEENILLKIFNMDGKIDSGEEISLLYRALLSMVRQAKEMQLEFAEEVRIMCKKKFSEKILISDQIWVL